MSNVDLPQGLSPVIFGIKGYDLLPDERAVFADIRPAGFILFQRNCDTPDQLKKLTADLRAAAGWDAPILIDNEGGRVQRTKAPNWPAFPPMKSFGDLYVQDKDAAQKALIENVRGLAAMQLASGIDVDCIPVLDVVPQDSPTKAIGDRAFSHDPDVVSALGIVAARAAVAAGMTPVMKHMPGHGRALVDSHYDLPVVDAISEDDLKPFRAVAAALGDEIWGMSAHIIFRDIDAGLPGTLSAKVINDFVRGYIGFDGVLVSDDLYMHALDKYGDLPTRVAMCLDGGCDLALHCHGEAKDFERAAKAAGSMREGATRRLDRWLKVRP